MTTRDATWTRRAVCLVALLLIAPAPPTAQPISRHLRIIVPAGPGGAWDTTARVIQPILQAADLARTSSVENIPGGSGLIGLTRFVSAERGDADAVMVLGAAMIGATILNRSAVTLADVTPIARLASEYVVVLVNAQSPLRSVPELIQALRDRPESVSWAGGNVAGTDHLVPLLIADAIGLDLTRVNFVPFNSGGAVMTAVLGGHVSVGVNYLTPAAPYVAAGQMRVLGVAGPERIPGLDAPTLGEHGLEVVVDGWRGLVAPPGLSMSDREGLERAAATLVNTREWRDVVARYGWNDRFLSGADFAQYLEAEEAKVRPLIRRLGLDTGNTSTGTAPYPLVVTVALVLAVAAFARQQRRQGGGVERAGPGWRGVLLVATGMIVQVVYIERIGFIPAATILFWLTARAFDPTHPIRDAGWAVGLSVCAHLLFARLLELPLPTGGLEGWL